MGSFRLLSCVASFLAFVSGLILLANARPLEEEASTSRELLNWCPPSGCPTYDPGCNRVPLSDLCYFTTAMLKLNPMPVTTYYCGLSCPSWRAKSPGQYNIISQKDCPAVTCAKTIGQVTAQNGGCASSAGYINAQAYGETKELYYNVDGSWITSQLKGFCMGGPTTGSLTAVAGMLAEGFASSLATTCISGTQYVCGCCNGQETATQTISAFTSAGARARVQAFVQAVTVVFGPGGDCDNADVLAQAISTADALAEDLIQIIDGFYNQISLSKFGTREFYNQVCTSADVPVLDHIKIKFANAYACAIVSVLSSASITTNPNPTGTTVTDYSASCSDNYEIAFSTDWVKGTHTAKCANACKCDKASLTSGAGCPAGIKVCPGGTCEYVG